MIIHVDKLIQKPSDKIGWKIEMTKDMINKYKEKIKM